MSHLGPFQPDTIARINWEVLVNGVTTNVVDPRIERIVAPDGTYLSGYPRPMYKESTGTYILETSFKDIGNYTAIMQAEYGNETIETIAEFVVEKPFGFPRIEIATNN